MFCAKCGKEMDDNAKFCPSCGAEASGETAAEQPAADSLRPNSLQLRNPQQAVRVRRPRPSRLPVWLLER